MEDNSEAVRRLYDAFNRRDTAATHELMDPEIEWVNPTGCRRAGDT
jgi:ketosteroid isomerase-like protein